MQEWQESCRRGLVASTCLRLQGQQAESAMQQQVWWGLSVQYQAQQQDRLPEHAKMTPAACTGLRWCCSAPTMLQASRC